MDSTTVFVDPYEEADAKVRGALGARSVPRSPTRPKGSRPDTPLPATDR